MVIGGQHWKEDAADKILRRDVHGKHFKCEWNTYFERRLDRSGRESVETGSGRMEILRRVWYAGI